MSETAGLRRFREPPAAPPQDGPSGEERCEMCRRVIAPPHSHLVDVQVRSLMCVCRPCYLLSTRDGAAHGRFRAVPDRYLHDPSFRLTDQQWERLQIPVGMAFFFHNSVLGRFAAFYPSPAGATESLLPADVWCEILTANPAIPDVRPDVEALLLRRRDDGVVECFLVPIDACYDLVGRVRLHWRGFTGGAEVWHQIGDFFDRIRERSRRP
jgi:Family of unknown function (DUF5947)